MSQKTKPVKRGENADMYKARKDLLIFVRGLAQAWVDEGMKGDNPGVAREAYELLRKYDLLEKTASNATSPSQPSAIRNAVTRRS